MGTRLKHAGSCETYKDSAYHPSNNSNMTNQYDSKYTAPEETTVNGPIRIKVIYIHPVESRRYIEIT